MAHVLVNKYTALSLYLSCSYRHVRKIWHRNL